jgi:predicted dehydrogenase
MVYNVAVIGAGAWSKNHLAGWRAQKDAAITWVVRSSEEKARQRAEEWGVPNYTGDYRKVLADPNVHIVDILVPHDMHAEVALAALAAGKHIVMEKPIANNLANARDVVHAARDSKLKFMVAENWNYASMVVRAKKLIEEGAIGKPILVRAYMDLSIRGAFDGIQWRHEKDRMGGGVLIDAGTHAVSACRFLLGDIVQVSALTNNFAFEAIAPLEDTAVMLVKFASGAIGTISVTAVAARERMYTAFDILGDKGTIEIDTHTRSVYVTTGGKRAEEFTAEPSRGLVDQISHFMACLRDDTMPLTTPMEQMGSMRAILAAYESEQTGKATDPKAVQP